MTTLIYRECEFAACDSKWSIDGVWQRYIVEKKAITISYQGKEVLCFMAGDHVMIALMQALQLKVITPDQYASLQILYLDIENYTFDMVMLDKQSGEVINTSNKNPVRVKGKPIAYSLDSTGGEFALECLYYAERKLKKKRRNRTYSTSPCGCKVASAVRYACRRDIYSDGKIYKSIWDGNGLIYNNIPLSNQVAIRRYCQNLQKTLVSIHEIYKERISMRKHAPLNPAASLSTASRPKKAQGTPTANNGKNNQMTTSRAISYALLFSE